MSVIALKKAWSFVKHYWYIPVVLIAFVVVAIVMRRKPDGLGNILKNAVESHQKEVKVLNDTHAEEIAKRNRALDVYHATVEQIESRYAADKKKLDKKKEKEIKRIIEENQDDPEALTQRISEYTGFRVIMPLEDNGEA